ncbi:hypothetical protein LCGC14_1115030 [marine sediment metagenome]|uniref:Phage portal protein n=1 Tax=marine sediment metagenome TaxID=412755 RepID=A0A0F9QBH1_9ZZZZ
MSIFDRIPWGRKSKAERATLKDEFGWLITALTYGPNPSGETVNERTAMGIAAYFAALRNISEDVAKLPRKVYRVKANGSRIEDRRHRVRELIVNPNPHMTGFTFWQTVLANALGYQAGYAEIVRDKLTGSDALQLWPLDSTKITPVISADERTLVYEWRDNGRVVIVPSEDMLVVHGLSLDGYTGFALARVASTTLGAIQAGNTFRASFFGNSLSPSGFFELPPTMSSEAVKGFMESMKQELQGPKKAHGAHVLPDGVKWSQGSIDPEKSQLLESSGFGIEEVARLFRMPPSKLQHMVNSSVRANIEQENTSYFVDTLSPWAIRIEEEINRKLFSAKERGTYFVEHVFNALMLADATARHDALAKGFGVGLYTINDMLKIENRAPVGPDGDVRFVPHNLKTLDEALSPPEEPEPPQEPEPVEPEPPEPEPEPEPKAVDTTPEPLSMDDPVIKAVLRLFRHDFRRFGNTEEEKAMRAMSNRKLSEWAKNFYPTHARYIEQTLGTRYGVLLGVMREEDGGPEGLAQRMAKEYVRESRERIMAGTRNENIDTLDRFSTIMAVRAVNMVLSSQEAA